MRRTKIVCTIGPASESLEVIKELIKAGMNVARLNFSHGTHDEHAARIATIRQASRELGIPVAIMLDTKGPEIRLGYFKDGKVVLEEGDIFTLTTRQVEGDRHIASVNYPGLPNDVEAGHVILLNDGLMSMEVIEVNDSEIKCRVLNRGELSNRKKINLPGTSLSLPAMSEQDIRDIRFGIEQGVDFFAVSFVRKAADVLAVRRLCEEENAAIEILAKIENPEGVNNLDEILKVADGLMVARGDLGVEIPVEEVPILQKLMSEKCNKAGKPVIIATQMLESMIGNPRPTRAEANDVANAIFDGADAIMLSAETASGKYPVEAVRTMAKIAERTERALNFEEILRRKSIAPQRTVTDAVSHATCQSAQDLNAAAIITATESGFTARMISKYRPQAPILAATPHENILRKLSLVWGVYPVKVERSTNTDEMINTAVQGGLRTGIIKNGDLVIITAGVPVGLPGTTNLMKVHIIGDVVARGMGIGQKAATGKVCVVRTVKEATARFMPGNVLVVPATDHDFVPIMSRAAAVITEEGGLTSHAAIVCLNLGIPVIVGVEGATRLLQDGMIVTVDSARGLVYKGEAQVM